MFAERRYSQKARVALKRKAEDKEAQESNRKTIIPQPLAKRSQKIAFETCRSLDSNAESSCVLERERSAFVDSGSAGHITTRGSALICYPPNLFDATKT